MAATSAVTASTSSGSPRVPAIWGLSVAPDTAAESRSTLLQCELGFVLSRPQFRTNVVV